MAGRNQVEQILKLNSEQYKRGLKDAKTAAKSEMSEIGKALQVAGSQFRDYTEFLKKKAAESKGTLKDLGKAFAENLGRGALVGGVGAGLEGVRRNMEKSIETGMSFGRALAQLASRADLSQAKLKELRKQFGELAKDGSRLESLPDAMNLLYGATGSVGAAQAVLPSISKASTIGNGDAAQLADFVVQRLKGEGRAVSQTNVDSVLQSLVTAQRNGEFNNMSEAMAGLNSVSGDMKKRAGLSDREYAAILSGATHVGASKEQGLSSISSLIGLSQQGFGAGSALSGMLGVTSFNSNGHFDINKLAQASQNLQRNRGSMSDNDLIRLFSEGGLSEEDSSGLLTYLKDFDKFKRGMDQALKDTKTFGQVAGEATDNLSDKLNMARNQMVIGFDEILAPLEEVGKKFASGHVGAGLMGLPGALGSSAKSALIDHPMLTAGALATTAAGGFLLKKLGLGEGALGTAGGVAKGLALKQAGVTPVYVTNFSEMGGKSGPAGAFSDGGFMDSMEKMAMGGNGGFAGGAKGAVGYVARLRALLGGGLAATGSTLTAGVGTLGAGTVAGGAAAAGVAGYAVGKYAVNPLLDAYTQGSTKEGFEGNIIEQLFFKLDKLLGGDNAAQIMRVQVEMNDQRLKVVPKANDKATDARSP